MLLQRSYEELFQAFLWVDATGLGVIVPVEMSGRRYCDGRPGGTVFFSVSVPKGLGPY